jgi:hypothetical protein
LGSTLAWTNLHPDVFMENLLNVNRLQQGAFVWAAGEGPEFGRRRAGRDTGHVRRGVCRQRTELAAADLRRPDELLADHHDDGARTVGPGAIHFTDWAGQRRQELLAQVGEHV